MRRSIWIPDDVFLDIKKAAKSNELSLGKYLISLHIESRKGVIVPLPTIPPGVVLAPVVEKTVDEVREMFPDQEPEVVPDEREKKKVEKMHRDGDYPLREGLIVNIEEPEQDWHVTKKDSSVVEDEFFVPYTKEHQTREKKK